MTWEPKKEYELRVIERNDARRELEEARAWMREAQSYLNTWATQMESLSHARKLAAFIDSCPVPPENE
jgi:hypothetical protein